MWEMVGVAAAESSSRLTELELLKLDEFDTSLEDPIDERMSFASRWSCIVDYSSFSTVQRDIQRCTSSAMYSFFLFLSHRWRFFFFFFLLFFIFSCFNFLSFSFF